MSKHIYFRVTITLLSPLCIGGGTDNNTDLDLIRDSRGKPLIPGTVLAGLYREAVRPEQRNEYFGFVERNTAADNKEAWASAASKLIIYDGVPQSGTEILTRDSVALNEYKAAQEGAKFDFEVVKTGAVFISLIELRKEHADLETPVEEMLALANNHYCGIGHKSARGYGAFALSYQKIVFDFSAPTSKNAWLAFKPFADSSWANIAFQDFPAEAKPLPGQPQYQRLSIPLKLVGGLSIREYLTARDDETTPDYQQMTIDNAPVIPGTSWAGAIRARMLMLIKQSNASLSADAVEKLFGKLGVKSKIIIDESTLTGGIWKTITRNAIDRFSGATKDSALYKERTYYHGETTLVIKLPVLNNCLNDHCLNDNYLVKKIFLAALADLCQGYLSLGGLTAVGRGIFSLNGKITFGDQRLTLEQLTTLINTKITLPGDGGSTGKQRNGEAAL